jgi:hypothetical protein
MVNDSLIANTFLVTHKRLQMFHASPAFTAFIMPPPAPAAASHKQSVTFFCILFTGPSNCAIFAGGKYCYKLLFSLTPDHLSQRTK